MAEPSKYAEFDSMLRAERRRRYRQHLIFLLTFAAFLIIIYGLATFSWSALGGGAITLVVLYSAGILERRRTKTAD